MRKNSKRDSSEYEEDEWGRRPDKNRKRYDKVKVAIKKARRHKRRQKESTFYEDGD